MSEDMMAPYILATLAFPDTRLTSERLWVSSALSVLRARQRPYLHPLFYAAYEEAIVAMEGLEAFLRDEEEESDASPD